MFCSNCGGDNPSSSTFCNRCGVKLSATAGERDLRTQRSGQFPPSDAKTDGRAVASLILGILSVTILWVLAGIPAIILGHISRSSIRKSLGQLKGDGMAVAGLIMGYISVAAIPVILIVAAIAIPSLLRARQAAQESAAVLNLRTINSAESTYFSSEGGKYGTIPQLIDAGLLDARYAGPVSGYTFSVTASRSEYLATARPISSNTGRYGYMSTTDAMVRYQTEPTSTCNPCFPSGQAGQPVL
jgi:type II secretory pathway pseudopilin PulG